MPVARVLLNGTEEFGLDECHRCKIRYFNPMPDDRQLADFYSPQYYGGDWYKQLGKGMAFARRELSGLTRGLFLDVGCSLGHFIEGIRRHSGWNVAGVEWSHESVRFARTQLGLDVREGELADGRFDTAGVDFLHVNNVLEHVRDPIGFLNECRRILRPGGTFCLCVPNGWVDSHSLIRFYHEERRPGRSKDGHLFFFHRQALLELLERRGFRLCKSYSFGIRRGLRALGWYPNWHRWKDVYEPFTTDVSRLENHPIKLAPARKRPDWYYYYRFEQARLKSLPGLHDFALDFRLYLK
ncbi:MAG TPA: class I SAM-dependent methyltransferase [Acidobacteriota bacterium]|nr:class I SAM-dependent methyltransferase [Acidobacteriota bacterium]